MAVNQDIKKLIERIKYEHRINQSEIAARLDVSKTYLSDIINGRAPLNDAFIERIRTSFGLVPGDESEQSTSPVKDHKTFGGQPSDPVIMLPLIPIDAVAGFPGDDNDSVMLSQCERYAVPEFTAKGADFLIRVSGSSMTPTFNNGDLLACRKINEITFFQWGTVYIIDTNQGALVKRLFEDKTDKTRIVCKSDNFESFPEFTLPKDGIRSLSIVIGLIRLE